MMQRDETILLEPWFRYYGYLFGFENLAVFDNGSTQPDVISSLRRYERAGATVLWEHNRVEDFHAKGSHFINLIKHWDAIGNYDFALPVDCDEFLALMTPDGVSCTRDKLHHYLDGLAGEQQALGFEYCFYNVPGFTGCFWMDRYPKSFLAANTIADLDHGFHAATSRKSTGRRSTKLTYLHYHNKPFEMVKSHARRKLELFADFTDLEALRYYEGPGVHLKKYFFMTEDEYFHQFDDKLLICLPGFADLMYALGVVEPLIGIEPRSDSSSRLLHVELHTPNSTNGSRETVQFDAALYLALNPDVAASDWEALEHFLTTGFGEGRSLNEGVGQLLK